MYPIYSIILVEKISFKVPPIKIEMTETIKAMANNIILAIKEIVVFLIPYVIPIPKESILLEIVKIKAYKNIKTPLYT